MLKLVPLVVGLFLLASAWYAFLGSKPRVAWTVAPAGGATFAHARWFDRDHVLTLSDGELALRAAGSGQAVWTAALSGKAR